eukprot:TRINITY_DN5256_c0_g1_i1.p1 TRINITY_DN5256_c0_g1~~TRINITY_DN5256_c0_g1_i1.p1  ORF type:complete len:631 (+),score=209.69 TRINITY_DN5256_c0_g1_i1:44-1894(+)
MELIRIQSSEGQVRINAPSNETILWLKEQVSKEFKTETSNIELSFERNGSKLLDNKATLSSQNIKRGVLLYCIFKATPKREIVIEEKNSSIEQPKKKFENHYVDEILSKEKAMIPRKRDERYCGRHGNNGACIECMPLPPWRFREVEPWKSNKGIAHIPFHSWLRMKTESAGTNKYFIEEETYIIPKTHVAKPKTVLPTGQEYRHVDHVSFQSADIVGQFIGSWRNTGNQRIGILFGKYIPDPYIPLGVRAVVEAIYEPPQRNSKKGSKLLDDKNKDKVDEFAKLFGLERIGMIFTAIEINEKKETIVSRSIDNGYLVSGPEYIQAAKFQNSYRNPNKQSTSGEFGSKFVSVMVTGIADEDEEPPKDNKDNKDIKIVENKKKVVSLGTRSFQVSNQCEWLVREKVIRANKKDFSVLEVRKSKTNYVPRILYTSTVEDYKGEKQYAPKIQKEANEGDSFPPEFFFIKLADSIPKKSSPLFASNTFPKENRNDDVQNDNYVTNNLKKGLFQGLSDFSLLLYLYLNSKVPLNILQDIAKSITTTNPSLLNTHQDFFKKLTNTSNPTLQKPTNNTSSTQLTSTQKSALESLISMGFDEKKSLEALRATNFNIENALNFLY